MQISIENTGIEGAVLVKTDIFKDNRGQFREIFRADLFKDLGLPDEFVQLNQSRSLKNVLRGLHFQWNPPMGKLMRVTVGEAFLVAVDIRIGSATFGRGVGFNFTSEDARALWAPAGFARGLCALSDVAEIEYLCTGIYNSECESGIIWNDPNYLISWPIADPILSSKDRDAQTIGEWLEREEANCFRYEET